MRRPVHWVLLAAGLFAAAGAHACTCAQSTPAEQFQKSKQVFLAKVIDRREIASADRTTHAEASIEVIETFKGAPRNGDILRSGIQPRTYCEMGLGKGEVYMVYLAESQWITICNSHAYVSERDRDEIRELRALRNKK